MIRSDQLTHLTLVDLLARIEQRLTAIHNATERQTIEVARLADYFTEFSRRSDWNDIQVSQMLRVIAEEIREVRTTQVYAMINDGPVSLEKLEQLVGNSDEETERAGNNGYQPNPRIRREQT